MTLDGGANLLRAALTGPDENVHPIVDKLRQTRVEPFFQPLAFLGFATSMKQWHTMR